MFNFIPSTTPTGKEMEMELDRVAADEAAHDAQMMALDAKAERAVYIYGDAARDELRDDAMADADAIRDVLADLSDTTMVQVMSAAMTGDAFALQRLIAPALIRYVNEAENDELDIERVAVRMLGDD